MSDYNYGGWGHYGFAANDNGTITASYTALTLGQVAGITRSQGVPDDAHLYDILFELSSMVTGAGAPGNISFYLARDSAGTKPLTPILTAPIVTALGAAVATGTGGNRSRARGSGCPRAARGASRTSSAAPSSARTRTSRTTRS